MKASFEKNVLGLIVVCLLFLGVACTEKGLSYSLVTGQTMGTSYSIKFSNPEGFELKANIDSTLESLNMSLSTYIPNSSISKLNRDSNAVASYVDESDTVLVFTIPRDTHFMNNFSISKKYHNDSRGFFDPTVMPLVNYWGFGYTEKKPVAKVDSNRVKTLLARTDFEKWLLTEDSTEMTIRKPRGAELDFSAVAKGYAVDCLAGILLNKDIEDFMVEIGGEVRTQGLNPDREPWKIGLSKPLEKAAFNDFEAVVELNNTALASSGNYRNYHKVDGKVYGHEINPNTGYPEFNTMLGASVMADKCSTADALATAFMVMGMDRSKQWLESQDDIRAVLLYLDDEKSIGHYIYGDIQIQYVDQ